MLGLDDALVKPDGTWDLAKACTVSDRSVIGLSAPHLMFEVEQAEDTKTVKEAVRFLIAWIDVHLPDHTVADIQEPAISLATARAVTQGTPTVVAFYAPWCNQCDRINRFIQNNQARTKRALRFMKINVDDSANRNIVQEFAVGTLPQIVFLEPDGTIASTILGDTTAIDFAENVNRLIRTGNVGAVQTTKAPATAGAPPAAAAAAKATPQGH
jgi:thioredoxin 1